MKKLYALMAVVTLVVGAGAAFAGDWSGSGEIIELGCYKSQNAQGADHAACAKKCLTDGKEMGLLMDGDTVVKLMKGSDAAPYEALIDLAGKVANVTGTEADGVVTVTGAEAG